MILKIGMEAWWVSVNSSGTDSSGSKRFTSTRVSDFGTSIFFSHGKYRAFFDKLMCDDTKT
jgi:hypothetical protein